mmetsp:Transcript_28187/g.24908  ORF Transcript_28187/g.24908 Transcript_28187/m.24908 type:complete len:84 (-) Transcript_28187:26-277(-)
MMQQKADNFLACKEPIDGMWRCFTEGKLGNSIRDAPDYVKPFEKKYYDCLFREGGGNDICQQHFHDMVRSVYREGDGDLCDFY